MIVSRAIVTNALGDEIIAPEKDFVPYKGLTTPQAMRRFCQSIRDSERNVRRGVWDRTLWAYLNPDEASSVGECD